VELTLEIHREGARVVQLEPSPLAPDEERGLAWLGSLRVAELRTGRYEIVVRARQGESAADETMAFDVTASAPTDKPTGKESPEPGRTTQSSRRLSARRAST
jgi:hypothetical protein